MLSEQHSGELHGRSLEVECGKRSRKTTVPDLCSSSGFGWCFCALKCQTLSLRVLLQVSRTPEECLQGLCFGYNIWFLHNLLFSFYGEISTFHKLLAM